MNTWRERLRPLIARVLAETEGLSDREIRRALRQAWDDAGGGERANWPYQVWLSEIKLQRNPEQQRRRRRVQQITEGQEVLF